MLCRKTNSFQLVKGKSKHFPNTNCANHYLWILLSAENLKLLKFETCITQNHPFSYSVDLLCIIIVYGVHNNCERWACEVLVCICGGENCVQCWRPSLSHSVQTTAPLWATSCLWDVLREEGGVGWLLRDCRSVSCFSTASCHWPACDWCLYSGGWGYFSNLRKLACICTFPSQSHQHRNLYDLIVIK